MKALKIILSLIAFGISLFIGLLFYEIIRPSRPGSHLNPSVLFLMFFSALSILFGFLSTISLLKQLLNKKRILKHNPNSNAFFPLSQMIFGILLILWAGFAGFRYLQTSDISEAGKVGNIELRIILMIIISLIFLGTLFILQYFRDKKISSKSSMKIDISSFGEQSHEP